MGWFFQCDIWRRDSKSEDVIWSEPLIISELRISWLWLGLNSAHFLLLLIIIIIIIIYLISFHSFICDMMMIITIKWGRGGRRTRSSSWLWWLRWWRWSELFNNLMMMIMNIHLNYMMMIMMMRRRRRSRMRYHNNDNLRIDPGCLLLFCCMLPLNTPLTIQPPTSFIHSLIGWLIHN